VNNSKKAYIRALQLLSKKSYSEKELKEKLNQYDKDVVDRIIKRLKKDGLVDDRNLSEKIVEKSLEQIYKQLNKLIDVIKVQDLTGEDFIERELALIKVSTANFNERQEVMQLVEIFRAKIVDVGKKTLTIEAVGSGMKINALLDLIKPFGIKELIRTGKIAISREFGKK